MHLAFELFAREAIFVLLLAAFGSGIVVHLDSRFDAWSRIAFSPVLGLCVGVCLFTSLEWFWSGTEVKWVAPILAAVSMLAAAATLVRRHRGAEVTRESLRLRTALQLAAVAAAVLVPASVVLLANHSVGPTAFEVYDTVGYVAEADGLQAESIHDAIHAALPVPTMIDSYLTSYSWGDQQLDAAPLSAAINAFIGLHSTDTQSAFLIAIWFIGALGAWSTLRFAIGRRSPLPTLGACFFGGSFFVQLFFDGSQGAICGIALLLPLMVVFLAVCSRPSLVNLAVLALVAAGSMTVYPIFWPAYGAVLLVGLAYFAARTIRRHGRRSLRPLAIWGARFLAVAVVAALLDFVSFRRNVSYWRSLLHQVYNTQPFPPYHLGAGVVPSWLLQTRGLYSVAFGPQSILSDPLFALIVPLIALALIVPAIRRNPLVWLCLALGVVVASLGTFEGAHNACGYCEDRNLLPIAPIMIFVAVMGLAALFASAARWRRSLAAAVSLVLLASIVYSTENEFRLFSGNAYVLTSAVRHMIDQVPESATIQIEGFGEGPRAPAEEPIVYEAVWEHTNGSVSVLADVDDRSGLAYFGVQPLTESSWFRANYGYVLTRLPGIATRRKLIAQEPGVAVQRRSPIDVVLDSGVAVTNLPSENPTGGNAVAGPVEFVATEPTPGPLFLRATFELPKATSPVPPQPGVIVHRSSMSFYVCQEMSKVGVVQRSTILVPPGWPTQVTAMSASDRQCRR